jgi:predicted TIM-barrel fold metal-dependent hydrolase
LPHDPVAHVLYRRHLRIDVAVSLVEGLPIPVEDREKILGGNARRLFHLDPT